MHRVIQVTETGEEFCQREFRFHSDCVEWIRDNEENFPESSFNIESEYEDCLCSSCNGSGEGMYDGTTCRVCKGRGVV